MSYAESWLQETNQFVVSVYVFLLDTYFSSWHLGWLTSTAYKSSAADIAMLMLFWWCKSVIMWDVLIFQWKLLCILSSCFGFLTCIDKSGFCVTQHSDTCSLTAEPRVETDKQIRATETTTLFPQFCLLYLLKFRPSHVWFLVTISCSCRPLKPCFLQAFSCWLPFYIQWFNVVL